MSKRNWNSIAATWIAVTIAALAVCAYLTIDWLWKHAPDAVHHDYESSRYAQRAQDRINSICVGLEGIDLLHCEYEISQPERDNYRSQKDLSAQWYMAVWAGFMTLLSLGTLIVTALGVFVVRQTLVQTAETNAAALEAAKAAQDSNDIMRMEQRPWISLLPPLTMWIENIREDRAFVQWLPNYENKGKSPAFRVSLNWEVVRYSGPMELKAHLENLISKNFRRRRLSDYQVCFPGERSDFTRPAEEESHRFDSEGPNFGLVVPVVYDMVGVETAIGLDARAFNLKRDADIVLSDGEFKLLEFATCRIMK